MVGREIARAARAATVKLTVNTRDGKSNSGTGFFVEPGNRVVTCRHVIQIGRSDGICMYFNGAQYVLKLLYDDASHDLSILEAPFAVGTTLPLGSYQDVQVGDDVYFAGFPSGVNTCSIFRGIVSAKGPNLVSNYPFDALQINGVLNKGNSGGPLLDTEGTVVGVCSAKYVPLFTDIESFQNFVKGMPDVPKDELQLSGVDFGEFFGIVKSGFDKTAGVLILISTGIGYAVPVDYLTARLTIE